MVLSLTSPQAARTALSASKRVKGKLSESNNRGLTPRDMAERRGISGSAYDLLCQLELEVKEAEDKGLDLGNTSRGIGGRGHTLGAAIDVDSTTRLPRVPSGRRRLQASGQSLSGLWQECATELGSRNFLLLLLGVVAFSLYMAFILTGMHLGSHGRIPIEVH